MAEYNVNDALEAYDSANPNDRKTWELVFGNTQNGINWANSVNANASSLAASAISVSPKRPKRPALV
jgi:hypothetical protein